jgi:hypothetical protein
MERKIMMMMMMMMMMMDDDDLCIGSALNSIQIANRR